MRIQILALCLLCSCSYHVRPTQEQAEIQATVHLVSLEGSCSGVAIGRKSILTAAHCVGAINVAFDYTGKVLCRATPVKVDEDEDVALLRTHCDLPVRAPIGTSEPVMGTRATVTGYPLGVNFPVKTDGYLTTAVKTQGLSYNKQVLSAPTVGGNSGGPVWVNGEVVGIVSVGAEIYHHINFVVRQSVIQKFLAGVKL